MAEKREPTPLELSGLKSWVDDGELIECLRDGIAKRDEELEDLASRIADLEAENEHLKYVIWMQRNEHRLLNTSLTQAEVANNRPDDIRGR